MGSCGGGGAHCSRSRVLVVFFCLWGLISLSCAARLSVSRQKLEVQKHLNRLNKPAVKSIEVLLFFPLKVLFGYRESEVKCVSKAVFLSVWLLNGLRS